MVASGQFHLIFFFFKFLLIYLCLAVLGLCCCGRTFSSFDERGPLVSCGPRASHCRGFLCCRAQALSTWALHLWHTGLLALRHVKSSQTRH